MGVIMTTITYGKSVNPVKDNAATRRHKRRAAEAIDRKLVESRILKALGQKPEQGGKPVVIAKRKPTMRAEMVTITHFAKPVSTSCCLPEVAIYRAGYRTTRKEAVHITK
jgi:hypothetical protein